MVPVPVLAVVAAVAIGAAVAMLAVLPNANVSDDAPLAVGLIRKLSPAAMVGAEKVTPSTSGVKATDGATPGVIVVFTPSLRRVSV